MPQPRKTVAMHILDGTYRPDRHGDRSMVTSEKLVEGIPEPPSPVRDTVTDRWREWWNYYCEKLINAGVLVDRDLACIAMLCDAHLFAEDAEQTLSEEGKYEQTEKGGLKAHPANVRLETARREIAGYLKELALTPIARMKAGPLMQDADKDKPTTVTGRRRG